MTIHSINCISLLLVLLPTLFWQSIRVAGVYPWGEGDASSSSTLYDDRQEDILQSLRRNMRLVAYEETFAQSLAATQPSSADNATSKSADESERVLFVKNLMGKTFVARNAVDVNATKKSGVNESLMLEDIRAARYNVDSLNRLLTNLCGLFQFEYWTYEWCHRVQMSQFHMEPTESGFAKVPNWSLGNYSRSIVVRQNGDFLNDSAPIIKVIDYFVDGQRCDETNRGRHTEVHIQCCEGMALQNYIPVAHYVNHLEQQRQQSGGMDSSTSANPLLPAATLNSITETEVCSYKATVCTPLLCMDNLLSESSSKGSKKISADSGKSKYGDQVYLDVMKTIASTCVVRTEEWWTYEICFGKLARQARYNTEQVAMPDGQVMAKQMLVAEYILGLPTVTVYTNVTEIKDLIRPRSVQSGVESITTLSELSRISKSEDPVGVSERESEIIRSGGLISPLFRKRLQKEPLRMLLEFNNGSSELCHEQNKRAILAELSCGPSDAIKSIFELSTCNYIIKVDLLVLCKLDGFSQSKDKISVIQFDPYFATPEERIETEEGEEADNETAEESKGVTPDVVVPDRSMNKRKHALSDAKFRSSEKKMDKSGSTFREATIDASGGISAETPSESQEDIAGEDGNQEEENDIFNNANQLIQ